MKNSSLYHLYYFMLFLLVAYSFAAPKHFLLQDLNTDPQYLSSASNPKNYTPLPNGKIIFSAETMEGRQLYVTDGTKSQTGLLKNFHIDLATGSKISDSSGFVVVANNAYFIVQNGSNYTYSIWKTDGTIAGTLPVSNAYANNAPRDLNVFNGKLYFSAVDANYNRYIYKTDGTLGNEVKAFTDTIPDVNGGSAMLIFNSKMYYAVKHGYPYGNTMKVYDGVASQIVKGFPQVLPTDWFGTNYASYMQKSSTRIYLFGQENSTYALYELKTNNDSLVKVRSFNQQGFNIVSNEMHSAGTKVVFVADTTGTYSNYYWITDGTLSGTHQLGDRKVSNPPASIAQIDTVLLMATQDGAGAARLEKMNLTTETFSSLLDPISNSISSLSKQNNTVYFSIYQNGNLISKLWKTDGTTAGTKIAYDFQSNSANEVGVTHKIDVLEIPKGFIVSANFDDNIGLEPVILVEEISNLSLSNNIINENLAAQSFIGKLNVSGGFRGVKYTIDPDSLVNYPDGAHFVIIGDSLKSNQIFDYEQKSNYHIWVSAIDSLGQKIDTMLSIDIKNLNDQHPNYVAENAYVIQNSVAGLGIAKLNANDPDGLDSLSFKVVGGDSALYFNMKNNKDSLVLTKEMNAPLGLLQLKVEISDSFFKDTVIVKIGVIQTITQQRVLKTMINLGDTLGQISENGILSPDVANFSLSADTSNDNNYVNIDKDYIVASKNIDLIALNKRVLDFDLFSYLSRGPGHYSHHKFVIPWYKDTTIFTTTDLAVNSNIRSFAKYWPANSAIANTQRFKLIEGDSLNYFEIDTLNGDIKLKQAMNNFSASFIQLKVEYSDSLTKDTSLIQIHLMQLKSQWRSFDVVAPVGTPLVDFNLFNTRVGENFSYQLKGSLDSALFVIQGSTLKANQSISFASKSFFNAVFQAVGDSGSVINSFVQIGRPVYTDRVIYVDKNTPVNQVITNYIKKWQPSDFLYNSMRFQLLSGDSLNYFSIDSLQGSLKVKNAMTSMQTDSLSFYVLYKDSLFVDTTKVTLKFAEFDLNLNGFPRQVSSGGQIGTFVYKNFANGENLSFQILSSPDSAKFTINGNVLNALTPLDFKQQNSYTIKVKAIGDQGNSVIRNLIITRPALSDTDIYISKGSAVGNTLVFNSNPWPNNSPYYSTVKMGVIGGDSAQYFTIDSTNGFFKFNVAQNMNNILANNLVVKVLYKDSLFQDTLLYKIHYTNLEFNKKPLKRILNVDDVIAIVATQNTDVGESFTYNINVNSSAADSSYFKMVGDTLKAKQVIDFSVKNPFVVSVVAQGSKNRSVSEFLYLAKPKVVAGEWLNGLDLSNNSLFNLSITTPNGSSPVTIDSIEGDSRFEISGANQIKNNTDIQLSTSQVIPLTIHWSSGGAKDTAQLKVHFMEILANVRHDLNTNIPGHTPVATLQINGAPNNATHLTSLIQAFGDNSSFNISGDTLYTSTSIDFSVKNFYNVQVNSLINNQANLFKTFNVGKMVAQDTTWYIPDDAGSGFVINQGKSAYDSVNQTRYHLINATPTDTPFVLDTLTSKLRLTPAGIPKNNDSVYSLSVEIQSIYGKDTAVGTVKTVHLNLAPQALKRQMIPGDLVAQLSLDRYPGNPTFVLDTNQADSKKFAIIANQLRVKDTLQFYNTQFNLGIGYQEGGVGIGVSPRMIAKFGGLDTSLNAGNLLNTVFGQIHLYNKSAVKPVQVTIIQGNEDGVYSLDTSFNLMRIKMSTDTLRVLTMQATQGSQVDTFYINVKQKALSPNKAPEFKITSDIQVAEDFGVKNVNQFLDSIQNEANQTLNVEIVASDTSIFTSFPNYDVVTNNLNFEVKPNIFGVFNLQIRLRDNGGVVMGGVDTSSWKSFKITVDNVNDAPTMTVVSSLNAYASTQFNMANFVSNVNLGPNEAMQQYHFNVTVDDSSAFGQLPIVDSLGTVSFSINPKVNKIIHGQLQLVDNGGRALGGIDTSASFPILINVQDTVFVNKAPQFTINGDLNSLEDAGPQFVNSWATGFVNEGNQSVQAEMWANDSSYFKTFPSYDPILQSLVYEIKPNMFGVIDLKARLRDNGGTANGGVDTSAWQSFKIRVQAVNDQPSLQIDSSVSGYSQELTTVKQFVKQWNAGPLENDQIKKYIVEVADSNAFSVLPSVDSLGTFTMKLAPKQKKIIQARIRIQDNGGTDSGGVDTSFPVMFNIYASDTIKTIVEPEIVLKFDSTSGIAHFIITPEMEWDTSSSMQNPQKGTNQLVILNPQLRLFVRVAGTDSTLPSKVTDMSVLPSTAIWWDPQFKIQGSALSADFTSGATASKIGAQYVIVKLFDSTGVELYTDSTSRTTWNYLKTPVGKLKIVSQLYDKNKQLMTSVNREFNVDDWKSIRFKSGSASSWILSGLGKGSSRFVDLGLQQGMVFRWSESNSSNALFGKYLAISNVEKPISGAGYWIFVDSANALQTSINPADSIVKIVLDTAASGWNQIANPYAFPVSVSQLNIRNPEIQFWGWDADKASYYEEKNELKAYGAYWVQSNKQTSLIFEPILSRVESGTSVARVLAKTRLFDDQWSLKLKINSDRFESNLAEFGYQDSSVKSIQLPSPQGSYLMLNVEENQKSFTRLLEKKSDNYTWTVKAISTVNGLSKVSLKVEGLDDLNRLDKKLVVNSYGVWMDVPAEGEMSISASAQGKPIQFKVVPQTLSINRIWSASLLQNQLELSIPLDFVGQTAVLSWYDISGQQVATETFTPQSTTQNFKINPPKSIGKLFWKLEINRESITGQRISLK